MLKAQDITESRQTTSQFKGHLSFAALAVSCIFLLGEILVMYAGISPSSKNPAVFAWDIFSYLTKFLLEKPYL